MNNKLTILLADTRTELASNKIFEIVGDLAISNTPTTIYEFESEKHNNILKANESKLNDRNIYIGKDIILEDMCIEIKKHKELYNIKYLIIDGLIEIQTKERYCLGRSDIVSIIIQQLKELAQTLDISVIITAPSTSNYKELNNNKSEILSYFCKSETAQDYIDEIVVLNKK